jgi:hypothetical protein
MNDKFLKPFNPSVVEQELYKKWEGSGYFNPDNLPDGKKQEAVHHNDAPAKRNRRSTPWPRPFSHIAGHNDSL